MSLRHPLAKVKGLGASGEGSHHWWLQRMTALALVPLSIWFVFSVLNQISGSHGDVIAWIAQPLTALLLLLYLSCMFFHAKLGLQVVIEDYVHSEGYRMIILLLMKAVILFAAAASLFAVLRVAL